MSHTARTAIILAALVLLVTIPSLYAAIPTLGSTYTISPGKDLRITILNQEPDPVAPGSVVKVRLRIENYGQMDVSGVKIELQQGYGFEVVDNAVKTIGTLKGAQTSTDAIIESYNIRILPETPEGQLSLKITQTSQDQTYPVTFQFQINVQTTSDALQVSDILTDPAYVMPGKEAKLTMQLANNADTTLKDVRVSLGLAGLDFSVLGSSNEQIVPFISGKKGSTVTFTLIPSPDMKLGVYKVPVHIEFKNAAGTSFSKDLVAGVVVKTDPKFFVRVDGTDIYTAEAKGKVTISVSNVGQGQLKYTTLSLAPNDAFTLLSAEKVYLGNIDSDDSQSNDYQMFVKAKSSKVPLKLHLEFMDEFNQLHTYDQTLELPLYTSGEASKLGLSKNGSITNLIFMWSIGVLLLVFWIYMIADVFMSQMPQSKKILWILVVILGTILGAAAYFFVGRKKKHAAK